MTDDDYIDFPGLIDEAMRSVVRRALEVVVVEGLPGDHHFFISFRTDYAGVKISPQLKQRYPSEMTIVLQHQFWDLKVEKESFSITLSFNNIPENLTVPFAALTAFADPSVKFGLQFHTFMDEDLIEEMLEAEEDLLEQLEKTDKKGEETISKKKSAGASGTQKTEIGDNVVVTLDSFRKKKKKTPSDKK